jgi:HEAT repeat protein
MQRRRTTFLLGALLLVLGVAALGWYWHTRPAQPEVQGVPEPATTERPKAASPPQESTYKGLPTSHWRAELTRSNLSSYWPPHFYPLRVNPDPAAIPVLRELLADPKPRTRQAAVFCLGLLPSTESSVLPLLVRAAQDPDSGVRLYALNALAKQGPAAAPVLLAALSEDDAKIRLAAAQGYYDITGRADAVLPALIRNLQADDEHRQMDSAYLLGKIGPPAAPAVDALVQRLEDPSAGFVSRAVLEALGDIGPDAKTALPTIRVFLKVSDGFVRASACVAYWKITGEARPAVEPLIEVVEKGGWYDKRQAAEGLGRIGPAAEAAVPALVRCLKDADVMVRVDAAVALGCIGPKAKEAIPTLLELLKTQKEFPKSILWAIEAIDPKAATKAGVIDP